MLCANPPNRMEDHDEQYFLKKNRRVQFSGLLSPEARAGQETYVSHPIRSLAQAYVYYSQCTPFGIYAGDKMVGYVMVIYDYDEETYNIWHMMIDSAFQGKGYGQGHLAGGSQLHCRKAFWKLQHRSADLHPQNEVACRAVSSNRICRNRQKR